MTSKDVILAFAATALLFAATQTAAADERSASDHVLKAELLRF